MPKSRLELVEALREWIGTPWQHQGRLKGVGVDCIGTGLILLEEGGVRQGRSETEMGIPNYARLPHRNQLQKIMEMYADRIKKEEIKIADAALIPTGHLRIHIVIFTPWKHTGEGPPFGIIHANIRINKVEEVLWRERDWHAPNYYRMKGLE